MADGFITAREATHAEPNYGIFADAVGGIATVVVAIIGLTGTHTDILVAVATIIFGAALLIHGAGMLSEFAHVIYPPSSVAPVPQQFGGGTMGAVFVVGAAGIVLGILALLGRYPMELTAISAIAFGAALALSSNSVWHLHMLRRASFESTASSAANMGGEVLGIEMASSSAGIQAVAGLAAVILGILAVVGINQPILILCALLIVGASILVTGSAISTTMLSFMRPSTRTESTFGGTGREPMA